MGSNNMYGYGQAANNDEQVLVQNKNVIIKEKFDNVQMIPWTDNNIIIIIILIIKKDENFNVL